MYNTYCMDGPINGAVMDVVFIQNPCAETKCIFVRKYSITISLRYGRNSADLCSAPTNAVVEFVTSPPGGMHRIVISVYVCMLCLSLACFRNYV